MCATQQQQQEHNHNRTHHTKYVSNNHRVFFAFPITQWVIAWMSENEIYKLCLNGKRSVNHQYRQNDILEETKRDASLRCMMTIRRLTAEAIYICWFDALFPCSLWIRQTDRPKSKQLAIGKQAPAGSPNQNHIHTQYFFRMTNGESQETLYAVI